MKHPANLAFYARWLAAQRRRRGLPEAPAPWRGYRFTVAAMPAGRFPLCRVGADLRAMLDLETDGTSFPALFAPASRTELTELLTAAAGETLAAVAGVGARREDGMASLELLLLPAMTGDALGAGTLAGRLSGLLAPWTRAPVGRDLILTSWRFLNPVPRRVHRRTAAPGIVLYEGAP